MSLTSFSPVSLWFSSGTWCSASLLLFGLLLYSCMVVCTEVEGRSRVIGSSQPIVSVLGDDAILPCRVEPQLNVENLTVQWWKPDIPLDPEDPLSDYKYVHSYHENHDEEDMKMSLYKGRTALNKDGLKHGDISLKIMNVRQSDQGRYRCQIPQLPSASVIELVVVTSWTTETPHPTINHQTPDPNDGTDVKGDGSDVKGDGTVVKGGRIDLIILIVLVVLVVVLILGGGVAGYLLKRKFQKLNCTEYVVESQVDQLDQL